MNIFKRIRNLWYLSGIEAPKDSHNKKDWKGRYIEKLAQSKLARIIETDKPNVFSV